MKVPYWCGSEGGDQALSMIRAACCLPTCATNKDGQFFWLRFSLCSGSAPQRFDVSQVLRPRSREFVLNQMFSREDSDGLIGESRTQPVYPSFFELNTVDRGQDIDSYRFHPDLENEAGCRQVFFR